MPIKLTAAQARHLLLAAQGIDQLPANKTQISDVRAAIRRLEVLQIDTISVVARSPYLVLFTRLGHYDPKWLDQLLADGALFEYWSHVACFLPIEDYPLYRSRMKAKDHHWFGSIEKWTTEHAIAVEHVMQRVREHGTVRSVDFERTDGKKGGWWEWKEEKIALDYLFSRGDLMIARRHNFQRVYALREHIMPTWDDSQAPPLEEVYQTFVLRTLKALGIAQANWIADYFRLPKRLVLPLVDKLVKEGQILEVEVAGWDKKGYTLPDNQALIEEVVSGKRKAKRTVLLSPFDPVVWDRARALTMFNFDYKIECYTPAPKRKYGYFTLPILWRDQLVGRLDPKAHRKDGIFEIKSLHLEPDVKISDALIKDVAKSLREYAAWHNTPEVVIRQSNPPAFAAEVEKALTQI